jgi:hypothetical protein
MADNPFATRLAQLSAGAPQPASNPFATRLAELDQPTTDANSPGTGEAFLRGGLQGASLGFGDEASAAIDTGVSKIPGLRDVAQLLHSDNLPALTNSDLTYQQRRDAYRARNSAAQEAHGGAYLGGEVAGGLATAPILPGGGAAKTAGQALIQGAKTGAALGAIQGLGSSAADLTNGDFKQAAADTAKGGIAGGLVGGALGYLGKKLVTKAPEKEANDILSGIVQGEGDKGGATNKLKKLVNMDKDDIVSVVRDDKELRNVIAKPASKALPVLHDRLEAVGSQLDPHYATVDKVTGGVSLQNLANVLDDETARLAKTPLNEQYTRAVQDIKNSIMKAWAPEMETELAAQKRLVDMGLTPHKEIPDVLVPTKDLRQIVTRLQTRGTEVINALNPGESSVMKADMAKMMKGVLDAHLDIAAEEGGEQVAKAVNSIRDLNSKYSALATMTQAVEQRGQKEATGAMSMGGHVNKLIHHGGMAGAGLSLLHGNIPGAAMSLAAPYAIPAAQKAGRALTGNVANLTRVASGVGADAARAQAILRLIQQGIPRAAAVQASRVAGPGGAQAPGIP